MKKKIFTLLCAVALIITTATTAATDSWDNAKPFEIVSNDKLHVFRFEPCEESLASASFGKEPGNTKATVYSIIYDDNNEIADYVPLYEIPELRSWTYDSNICFSRNFEHMFYIPPADNDIALEYYSNGVLNETYYVTDLVKDMSKVMQSEQSVHWRDYQTPIDYSQRNDTLQLTTVDDIQYVFDILSGEILLMAEPPPEGYQPEYAEFTEDEEVGDIGCFEQFENYTESEKPATKPRSNTVRLIAVGISIAAVIVLTIRIAVAKNKRKK